MVTSAQCIKKFGEPGGKNESQYMTIWAVPADIKAAFAHVKFSALGTIGFPAKIYCNKLLQPLIEKALRGLMAAGKTSELKTWDGCYIVRNKRLGSSYSLHSWGAAIDINAFENRQGVAPKLSKTFVKAFTDAGFEWGGVWSGKSVDGMHFQIKSL